MRYPGYCRFVFLSDMWVGLYRSIAMLVGGAVKGECLRRDECSSGIFLLSSPQALMWLHLQRKITESKQQCLLGTHESSARGRCIVPPGQLSSVPRTLDQGFPAFSMHENNLMSRWRMKIPRPHPRRLLFCGCGGVSSRDFHFLVKNSRWFCWRWALYWTLGKCD